MRGGSFDELAAFVFNMFKTRKTRTHHINKNICTCIYNKSVGKVKCTAMSVPKWVQGPVLSGHRFMILSCVCSLPYDYETYVSTIAHVQTDFACCPGGTEDGSFPLGFALCGLGFLTNVSVAVFLPDRSQERRKIPNKFSKTSKTGGF